MFDFSNKVHSPIHTMFKLLGSILVYRASYMDSCILRSLPLSLRGRCPYSARSGELNPGSTCAESLTLPPTPTCAGGVGDRVEDHRTENVGTVFGTVVPLHVPCQSFYPCCPVLILILVFLPSHCSYQNSRTIAPFQLPIQNDSPPTTPLPNFRPFSLPCNYPANITTASLPIPLTNIIPHQIPHPAKSLPRVKKSAPSNPPSSKVSTRLNFSFQFPFQLIICPWIKKAATLQAESMVYYAVFCYLYLILLLLHPLRPPPSWTPVVRPPSSWPPLSWQHPSWWPPSWALPSRPPPSWMPTVRSPRSRASAASPSPYQPPPSWTTVTSPLQAWPLLSRLPPFWPP